MPLQLVQMDYWANSESLLFVWLKIFVDIAGIQHYAEPY
jgi:hypothetical protein